MSAVVARLDGAVVLRVLIEHLERRAPREASDARPAKERVEIVAKPALRVLRTAPERPSLSSFWFLLLTRARARALLARAADLVAGVAAAPVVIIAKLRVVEAPGGEDLIARYLRGGAPLAAAHARGNGIPLALCQGRVTFAQMEAAETTG